ncbi:MAG: DNA polymerase III, partial [bacterium]|nr:DNA polymerase III [bacterium]
MNQEIATILRQIADLLEIKGVAFKPAAYRRVAYTLENNEKDIALVYQEGGLKAIEKISGIGKSIASKIEEYLQKGKIKYYNELAKETAIQQIIAHFFASKGLGLAELKQSARQRKIVYSRYTKP